jgi:hypothetical protein
MKARLEDMSISRSSDKRKELSKLQELMLQWWSQSMNTQVGKKSSIREKKNAFLQFNGL